MKNKDIYSLYEALVEISQDKELKFDIKASYYLACNKNVLEPFYNAIVETRNKVLNKYSQQAEEGWMVPKEHVEEFYGEWIPFMETENLIALKKIKLEDIKSEINVDMMSRLLPIIEEE